MAFDYAKLIEPTTVAATTPAAVYTVPSGKTAFFTSILLHNTNTTAETVVLHNVPASGGNVGTAAATNRFYKYSLAPDETIQIDFTKPGLILTNENDTIQAATTTGSKVVIMGYGATE